MNFKEWLMIENTVSQVLKASQPEVVAAFMAKAKEAMKGAWMDNVDKGLQQFFANWLVYQALQDKSYNPDNPQLDPKYNLELQAARSQYKMTQIIRSAQDYIAYLLTAEGGRGGRRRFNNPQFSPQQLEQESDAWHTRLAQQKSKTGEEGRPVIDVGNGWKWVSLDKEYCDREGKAMGHCGNAGYSEGDNIYSLRDPQNFPHLTFIVNNGKLGESKGKGNAKPVKQYHPAIVAFLLGKDNGKDIVEFIKGGGYKPENNFHFEDLSKEQQEQVRAVKPYIDDYFGGILHKYQGKPLDMLAKLNELFSYDFAGIQDQNVIVRKFDHIGDVTEWLKDNTQSKLDELPDLENTHDWQYDVGSSEAIETFDSYADEKNQTAMEQIIELLKQEYLADGNDEDDVDDFDVSWACEVDDELDTKLQWAAEDGYRYGAEADAYDHVRKHFHNEEDVNKRGFIINNVGGGVLHPAKETSHEWLLYISLADLGRVFMEKEEDEWGKNDLNDYIEYSYSQPYNGYSGFEKEPYNERLHELLGEALSEIEDRLKRQELRHAKEGLKQQPMLPGMAKFYGLSDEGPDV